MRYRYYYGSQADQFSFIRIPRRLMTDENLKTMSTDAKMLYGVLLDRMGLSVKNKWFDEDNRVYIIYPVAEIAEYMGVSEKLATKYLNELEKVGLVEKKKRGFGLPSILYVMNFMKENAADDMGASRTSQMGGSEKTESENDEVINNADSETKSGRNAEIIALSSADGFRTSKMSSSRTSQTGCSRTSQMGCSRTSQMGSSRESQMGISEPPKRDPLISYTNTNNTEESNTNPIFPPEDEMDRIRRMELFVKNRLMYDDLCIEQKWEKSFIDELIGIIVETLCTKKKEITVAGSSYPIQYVKNRLLSLQKEHIEYIIQSFDENTTKIKNVKNYMLTALFNAPATYNGHVRAEVNHLFAKNQEAIL